MIATEQMIPKNTIHKWFADTNEVNQDIKMQFWNDVECVLFEDSSLDYLKEMQY